MFFEQLVRAIDSKDTSTVASLARYPLRVNGKPVMAIAQPADLLRRYAQVFTDDVVKQVRTAVPAEVFCKNGSAMIGDGVVWVSADADALRWM